MNKLQLDALRKQARATAAAQGCKADLQIIGFPTQGSSAVSVKIVVTRDLLPNDPRKREVTVRLGEVGAATAVASIVRDTAAEICKDP